MNASDTAAPAGREAADVSVIMPAWRAERTIERALRSVAAQTVLPREVVVVDDGSGDATFERAKAVAAEIAPLAVRLFRQPNAGPGAARNRAIAESAGSVLAFLDADDEWLPTKLETSLRALDDPGTCLVAHDMIVESGGAETVMDCARHLPPGADAFVPLFKRGFVATATVVCRRDAVLAEGGFDESLLSGQDYELWLAIARSDGRGIAVLPEKLTRYHVEPGSVSSKVELRRQCSLRIARRHAQGLRGRASSGAAVTALRVAIVTAEAVLAHRSRGDWAGILKAVLLLPVEAMLALLAYSRNAAASDVRPVIETERVEP